MAARFVVYCAAHTTRRQFYEEPMNASRREFLINGAGALAAGAAALGGVPAMRANPLGKPIGLELYTVNAELDKDYDGTLRQVAAVGY
jgi:hypothetical protein